MVKSEFPQFADVSPRFLGDFHENWETSLRLQRKILSNENNVITRNVGIFSYEEDM